MKTASGIQEKKRGTTGGFQTPLGIVGRFYMIQMGTPYLTMMSGIGTLAWTACPVQGT